MSYHFTGSLNAAIFLLTLLGLWEQLRLIWRRKHSHRVGVLTEGPTAVLSLNQFVSSYLAFFSFFLYGASLERFNHYLVWTRLAACVLTLMVLWEIMRERRERVTTAGFTVCALMLLILPSWVLLDEAAAHWCRGLSQTLIVIATVILAQGYAHQIVMIRRTGRTGAVSIRMNQFFLLKDISTMAFALAMGLGEGWPLLLLSSVSALTKVATLWQFRWARVSRVAEQRRSMTQSQPLLIDEPQPVMDS